ncbi:MAG: 2-dehydropantoate 2-reductase [Desulfomonile sp.]|nr:2-dehydropantoate 2-reductase [Desulfomonile sp.]
MRVGIVGAGALGSVIGGLLWEAGVDVVLIRRNREAVDYTTRNGLHLDGVSGDRVVRPRIVADPVEAGTADLALVLVKSYDTEAAIPAVSQVLADDGVVLTLQNGLGNYEILATAFPGRVLLGITTIGALMVGPGHARHTGFGQTHLGELDGRPSERTRVVAEILTKMNAGPVNVVDNAVGCVWSKLIINAAINAPATLLEVRNGELIESQAGRDLIHQVVEECLSIVRAKGVQLIFDDPEARVIAVCQGTAQNLNSMLQDVRAGRRTENDFINGAVAREGERVGIPATANRTLALLVGALEKRVEKAR